MQSYQCFHQLPPEGFTLQQFSECMNGKPVGAVRVSVGIATSDDDLRQLLEFLTLFRDRPAPLSAPRTLPETVGG